MPRLERWGFALDFLKIISKIWKQITFNPFILLVIRLSRTGRSNQATYRVVVAEHSAPVQGKFVEILGFYNPAENKKFEVKEERVRYWMSVGAKPSDTVASLLKANGMSGMDEFISPRNKKRKKKNPDEEEEAPESSAPSAEESSATSEEPKPEVSEDKPEDKPAEKSEEKPETAEEKNEDKKEADKDATQSEEKASE